MTIQKTAKPAKHRPAKGGKADETAPATPDVTVADAPLDAEVTYTLPDLLARSGSATLDEAEAYLEGLTETDLAEEGAAVATPRVSKDCARLYGKASDFWLSERLCGRSASGGRRPRAREAHAGAPAGRGDGFVMEGARHRG